MATLITGSEGFLGARLAALLHQSGAKPVGFDVMAPKVARAWPVVVGDVTDRKFLEDLFEKHDVTSIIHAGGVSGPHVCNNFPARVFEINVQGTVNLFEIARVRKMPGRIVFLSSSSVYGQAAERESCKTPVVEGLPLLASEPYGASKVSCEALLRAYVGQDGVDAVSLRISIVYGAGRTAYCGITRMIAAALAKEPIPLDNGCDTPLPWVYIDDVCSAIRTALDAPKSSFGEKDTLAYNVTGPGYPTFREMAAVIQGIVPGSVTRETGEPDPYAMNARKMSLAAIERDLKWKPTVTIADGIQKLFNAMT